VNTSPGARAAPRSPKRRDRPGPLIVLAIVVLIPAVLLFATHRWAQAQITESSPPPAAPAVTPPPSASLTTPLLTARRMSTLLSRSLSIDAFRSAVEGFAPSLNDRSCVAVSVDSEPVAARNADLAVIPASTQKLLVAAVALDRLGDDFRYTTSARAESAPVAGAVQGDLFVVGGGDPLLSSDWYQTSNMERYPVLSPTRLETLADELVSAGVTSIAGNVVGDASRYDDEYFAPTWGAGVAGLEAGPYDSLMANDSRVLFEPLKSNDPALGAVQEFVRMLDERGVAVGGTATTGVAPGTAVELAAIESAPLTDVVGEMLANSDNNTAELMVKELGFDDAGTGTREAGLAVIQRTLDEWSVDTSVMVFADGSGLSPDNRVTCTALLSVLQRSDPTGAIGAGLPIAGQTGTLSDIFVDHPVAGRLLGKTGTLSNPPFNDDPPGVKALAGYVGVDGGSAIEYALVLNGPTISDQSEYRPVWTALADVLAAYPEGPTPADLGVR
jgi:D-alanyl-D-alanine carboxypeptidase/D-alanyl-D-alanine-endopeptidase (penicillin-binding protein 4)